MPTCACFSRGAGSLSLPTIVVPEAPLDSIVATFVLPGRATLGTLAGELTWILVNI